MDAEVIALRPGRRLIRGSHQATPLMETAVMSHRAPITVLM
jgi:hypothetical protein